MPQGERVGGLTRADLGARVVVRRSLPDGPFRFTDVLGELVALTTDTLTVRTRHGDVLVPLAEVHRTRRVPGRPR